MAKIAIQTQKRNSSSTSSSGLSAGEQQEISQLAYQFYIDRGCQHGHDTEDWLRAERIIRSRRKN